MVYGSPPTLDRGRTGGERRCDEWGWNGGWRGRGSKSEGPGTVVVPGPIVGYLQRINRLVSYGLEDGSTASFRTDQNHATLVHTAIPDRGIRGIDVAHLLYVLYSETPECLHGAIRTSVHEDMRIMAGRVG